LRSTSWLAGQILTVEVEQVEGDEGDEPPSPPSGHRARCDDIRGASE
jgi:hypothetical protein